MNLSTQVQVFALKRVRSDSIAGLESSQLAFNNGIEVLHAGFFLSYGHGTGIRRIDKSKSRLIELIS